MGKSPAASKKESEAGSRQRRTGASAAQAAVPSRNVVSAGPDHMWNRAATDRSQVAA